MSLPGHTGDWRVELGVKLAANRSTAFYYDDFPHVYIILIFISQQDFTAR